MAKRGLCALLVDAPLLPAGEEMSPQRQSADARVQSAVNPDRQSQGVVILHDPGVTVAAGERIGTATNGDDEGEDTTGLQQALVAIDNLLWRGDAGVR